MLILHSNFCPQSVSNAGICSGEDSVSGKPTVTALPPRFPPSRSDPSQMELSFKITAGLLLLVQALQPVLLQNSTHSQGIDPSWLRKPHRHRTPRPVVTIPEDGDEGSAPTLDPSHDYSSGITSGSMSTLGEEDVTKGADEELDDANVVTTPDLPGDLNLNVSATTPDSSNMTDFEREFNDSSATSPNATTSTAAENSTHWSNHSRNHPTTTSAPGVNATQELTPTLTTPAGGAPSANTTEPTETGTTEVSQTSASFGSPTTFQPSTSSGRSLRTTSLQVHDTPEAANKTGTAAGSGSGSERGGLGCFHLTLA